MEDFLIINLFFIVGGREKNRYKTWVFDTVIGKRFKVRQNYNETEVDGKIGSMPEAENSGFECSKTARLFRAVGLCSVARIYNFSISRAGALQLQFIPCIDNLGNPCMFDAVSKQTFRNQDNIDPESDFLYPSSESSTYSLRREIPAYGRMTEHGIQKLYHLPEDYEGEAEDFIKENNFKELVYTEKPNDGKNYIFHWKETDTQLVVVWTEVETEELEYV